MEIPRSARAKMRPPRGRGTYYVLRSSKAGWGLDGQDLCEVGGGLEFDLDAGWMMGHIHID